ncbi:BFD-like (2Fe-2S) binding domain family protein [Luminiphilus syltensis NOR5-1B]|uniref:Bacterioferritin-associated ferredoxin n=1 Tax=Luminiphilus syltensis NOR5-1B TaxID=565045 RepID=B8KSM5_9GAMM|nr:(2Fe-2S)-binding protein [Luminiphilus syltensis]EED34441.1 BFD-like (2Fe-2S) binding domain family protein [Luminiphilus syltensis NOR5-1B]
MLTIILNRINFNRMYVCVCKKVSDRAIAKAVAGGARSFREVRDELGVSTQCGKCTSLAREVVSDCIEASEKSNNFYDAGGFATA